MLMIAGLEIDIRSRAQAVVPDRIDAVRRTERRHCAVVTVAKDLPQFLLGGHVEAASKFVAQFIEPQASCGRQDHHDVAVGLFKYHRLRQLLRENSSSSRGLKTGTGTLVCDEVVGRVTLPEETFDCHCSSHGSLSNRTNSYRRTR